MEGGAEIMDIGDIKGGVWCHVAYMYSKSFSSF